jgi:plasmid stabilization system protein ParE
VKHHFHLHAEREHLARVDYYETQRAGLGAKYLDDFDATIAQVCEAPDRLKLVREPGIRRALFRVFPCSIVCREVSGEVQVLAVSHHRQRPGYWFTRL